MVGNPYKIVLKLGTLGNIALPLSSIIMLDDIRTDDLRDKRFRVDADGAREDVGFGLENPERTFNVLSAGFFHRVGVFFFYSIWNGYGSRKTRPGWINPRVVPISALLAIQQIEHVVLYAPTQHNIVQDRQLIEHVDVV